MLFIRRGKDLYRLSHETRGEMGNERLDCSIELMQVECTTGFNADRCKLCHGLCIRGSRRIAHHQSVQVIEKHLRRHISQDPIGIPFREGFILVDRNRVKRFSMALRGESRYCLCSGATTSWPSSRLFTCVLPRIQTILVGAFICCMPAGTAPVHPGPLMRYVAREVPVVRFPGDAKTFVYASIIGVI